MNHFILNGLKRGTIVSKLISSRKAAAVIASIAIALGGISATSSSAAVAKDWSCTPTKAKPVTIRMVEFFAGPARTPLLNAFARQYENANPGVKIDLISPSQADSEAKITQLLQA